MILTFEFVFSIVGVLAEIRIFSSSLKCVQDKANQTGES